MDNGSPFVLPSVYGRDGNKLYLHSSKAARLARVFAEGNEVCITMTHLDSIVYARQVFHNTVNYRSAVIHARGRRLEDEESMLHGLKAMAEHLAPGANSPAPDAKKLNRVAVFSVDLDEALVKVRNAPPADHGTDINLDLWAGILPIEMKFSSPVPQKLVPEKMEAPPHILSRKLLWKTGAQDLEATDNPPLHLPLSRKSEQAK